jgi:hypothetical protein
VSDIPGSIRRVLRADPLIIDLVGLDGNGEVKVYGSGGLAKSNVEPPFIAWSIAPGGDQPGAYGEKYVMQSVNCSIACWAHEEKKSWQLVDAVEEATERGDYDAGVWEFAQVRRTAYPQPLPDRDTSWFQVVVPLQFVFVRMGQTE